METLHNHKVKVSQTPLPKSVSRTHSATIEFGEDRLIPCENSNVECTNESESFTEDQLMQFPVMLGDSISEIIDPADTCSTEFDINEQISFQVQSENATTLRFIDSDLNTTAQVIETIETAFVPEPHEDINTAIFEAYQPDNNLVKSIDNNLLNKETANNKSVIDEGTKRSNCSAFESAFTLPEKYLSEKKRLKLQKSGKPKLPSAGTSDVYYNILLKKEEDKRLKEEAKEKRKVLLEEKKKANAEKKKMAEERKKLDAKIRDLTKKIKTEKQ